MLPYIVGSLFLGIGSLYYWRKRRRRALEERQLDMFIQQLVWDPDTAKYKEGERTRIYPIKPL